MKATYKQDTAVVFDRRNRLTGLKSLLYFLMMVALLCSMIFLPDRILASQSSIVLVPESEIVTFASQLSLDTLAHIGADSANQKTDAGAIFLEKEKVGSGN